jgi:hypothetical protein
VSWGVAYSAAVRTGSAQSALSKGASSIAGKRPDARHSGRGEAPEEEASSCRQTAKES